MSGYIGVVTTGIYCLPDSCSGRPAAGNTFRLASAAAAEARGLRACHRCRPYRLEAAPTGVGSEFVCRAIQMVLDGALHGGTEAEMAAELGVSPRHLRRRFLDEAGITPVQLARSSRSHFARRLLDDTDLSITEIAYASGFGSVRQFNRTMQEVFRDTPRALRSRRRRSDRLAADGGLALRLPLQPPLDRQAILKALEADAIPGVESVEEGWYRRIIVVDGDPGVLEVGPGGDDHLVARLHLPHWEGLIHHVRRARRIFRLDDPVGGGPPTAGTWDPLEVGLGSIARHLEPEPERAMARLVTRLGTPVPGLRQWRLTHTFPSAGVLRAAAPTVLGPAAASVAAAFSGVLEQISRPPDTQNLMGRLHRADLPAWLCEDVGARAQR